MSISYRVENIFQNCLEKVGLKRECFFSDIEDGIEAEFEHHGRLLIVKITRETIEDLESMYYLSLKDDIESIFKCEILNRVFGMKVGNIIKTLSE